MCVAISPLASKWLLVVTQTGCWPLCTCKYLQVRPWIAEGLYVLSTCCVCLHCSLLCSVISTSTITLLGCQCGPHFRDGQRGSAHPKSFRLVGTHISLDPMSSPFLWTIIFAMLGKPLQSLGHCGQHSHVSWFKPLVTLEELNSQPKVL